MARIYTGDYSPGDFRQWESVMNVHVPEGEIGNRSPLSTGPGFPPRRFYSAQVISQDTDAGYIGRYELRQNDVPWWGGGARSEVSDNRTFAPIGATRWYAMSFKFDPTFPTNHFDLGWGVIQQFHDDTSVGWSPPVAFGWPYQGSLVQPGNLGFRSDYWYLYLIEWPSAHGEKLPQAQKITPIYEFPFELGEWHDIKLEIKWEQTKSGFVRLWWNGERQKLYGGEDTIFGATLPPNIGIESNQIVTGQHVQLGYYRDKAIAAPGIVYNTGFRMADAEDSL